MAGLLEPEIPGLQRYARALTKDMRAAEDLVQSCLVRALSKEHLWAPGTDLRAWLFTILHNQHVNELRRRLREGFVVSADDIAAGLPAAQPASMALELRDLERALAALPREQREVVLLFGRDGMRYEEMSAVLRVPIGTVRSRLSRARGKLRELMGADGGCRR